MDSVYDEQEDYYGKCGELFLTVKGNIAFHCTLCESVYKNFPDYNDHVLEEHYANVSNEDLLDAVKEEDNSFQSLSGEGCTAEDVDLLLNENEESDIEIYTTEHEAFVPDQLESSNNEHDILDQLAEVPSKDLSMKNIGQSIEPDSVKSSNTTRNLSNKEAIRTHLRTINVKPTITNRKYKCPHCGFSGASKTNMNQHIQRHSLNKPHQCTECLKAFHTRTELRTHLRIHTGERPYLCTHCGQALSSSSELNHHQKRHDNIRDKECSICKMRFFTTKYLKRHMAVHSDKRDHKCQQCEATFKSNLALRTHMKLHENKREYQCKLCDSRFNQNAGLYSHMKSSHAIAFKTSKESVKNVLGK